MRIKKRWIVLALLVLAVFVLLRDSEPDVPKGSYLVIDLEGNYAELPPGRDALDRLLDDRPAFLDLLATLHKARHDERIDGVLLRAADEMHTSRFISDDTWNALAERYSQDQLVEVVLIIGNYTQLTMFQNTLGVPLPPDVPGLPEATATR